MCNLCISAVSAAEIIADVTCSVHAHAASCFRHLGVRAVSKIIPEVVTNARMLAYLALINSRILESKKKEQGGGGRRRGEGEERERVY